MSSLAGCSSCSFLGGRRSAARNSRRQRPLPNTRLHVRDQYTLLRVGAATADGRRAGAGAVWRRERRAGGLGHAGHVDLVRPVHTAQFRSDPALSDQFAQIQTALAAGERVARMLQVTPYDHRAGASPHIMDEFTRDDRLRSRRLQLRARRARSARCDDRIFRRGSRSPLSGRRARAKRRWWACWRGSMMWTPGASCWMGWTFAI